MTVTTDRQGRTVGLSIKIAPGIRVRASSRGIRTSLGPRSARIHVGAGRTRLSSGMGPVTLSTSVGGGRRPTRRSSGARPGARPGPTTSPGSAKVAEARRLTSAIEGLLTIHRVDVIEAARPMAPAPGLPDAAAVHRGQRGLALAGIGVLQRTARAQARRRAAAAAEQELEEARKRVEQAWAREQEQLDAGWSALCDNDVSAVLAAVQGRFDGHARPAAALSIHGDVIDLVVMAPAEDVVPERGVGTTAAGNLSVRKMPRSDRSALYAAAVAGHLMLALREAFAVAPGIGSARAVVVRPTSTGADCLITGVWTRTALSRVSWSTAGDAFDVARQAAHSVEVSLRGGTELKPLDPALPLVAALLSQIR